MKLREIRPELERLHTDELIQQLNYTYVFSIIEQIAEYYNEHLPLWRVLNYYGIPEPELGVDQIQVPCLLIEHGTSDRHASARYFSIDRETGLTKEQVYCYKCSKILNAFWYVYKYERDYHELSLKDIFIFLRKEFQVDFPRDLILDFDAEKYFTFDSEDDKVSVMEKFSRADEVRGIKEKDTQAYLDALVNLYLTVSLGGN